MASVGPDAHHIEESVLDMAPEDIAGHELCRGHVFKRSLGEDLAGHLSLGELQQEAVLKHGIHLESVSESHLFLGKTGYESQLLVDDVGGQYGVGSLDCIGSGQVVVLSGIDDDSGKSVDHPGEELVYHRSLHVDVAEQDAVERIIEHHVKSLKCTHYGYLGHTQAGAVVAQADVASYLLSHLVQGLAHDSEILLCGIGAAEALGSGSVRHIVQQGLTGGADDGDDVGTLTCGGLGLHHVLVDVARSHDHIDIGLGTLSYLLDIVLAPFPAGLDFLHRGLYRGLESLVYLSLGADFQFCNVQFAVSDLLCYLHGSLPGNYHGIAHIEQRAFSKDSGSLETVHHHIGKGHRVGVHSVYSEQTAQGSLHCDSGITVHKTLDIGSNTGSELPGVCHFLRI